MSPNMRKYMKSHDQYQRDLKALFINAGIKCEDLDQHGKNTKKTPDLICPELSIVIEIKTFRLKPDQEKEVASIKEQLKFGNMVTYEEDTAYRRFNKDLSDSRGKFKNYPEHHSLVVFIDMMAPFHEQELTELMKGEFTMKIFVPRDPSLEVCFIDEFYKNRPFNKSSNTEIGAVAQYFPNSQKLLVVHNLQAEAKRMLPIEVLEQFCVSQMIYKDDPKEPIVDKL